MDQTHERVVRLFATPWTNIAHQAPPSMGLSRQEYWSGMPFPSPGDLPDPGVKPRSPALQADDLTSEPPKSYYNYIHLVLRIKWRQDRYKKYPNKISRCENCND